MANCASFAMDEKKLHHLSKNKKNGWAPSSYTPNIGVADARLRHQTDI